MKALIAFVFLVSWVSQTALAQDDMPHNKLYLATQRLYYSRSKLACVGDSINADGGTTTPMLYGYIRALNPRVGWSGIYDSCAAGADIAGNVNSYPTAYDVVGCGSSGLGGSIAPVDGDGGALPGGERVLWPTIYGNGRFSTVGGDIPWGTNMWAFQLTAARRAVFRGGDWFTGTGTLKVVFYRGSTGFTSIGMSNYRGGSFNASFDNNAIAAGMNSYSMSLPSGAGDLQCYFYGSNPNVDERAKNLYLMGFQFEVTNPTGLTLGCIGIGSAKVADLINTAIVSDQSITDYVAQFAPTTVLINIGTNDGASVNATWKANLISLIQRWRAAIGSNFLCLLVSPYEQSGVTHAQTAQYMYEVASTYSDVCFFDQRAVAGPYAYLNANYLSDGVHPNAAGAVYFAGLLDSALQQATPEARVRDSGFDQRGWFRAR